MQLDTSIFVISDEFIFLVLGALPRRASFSLAEDPNASYIPVAPDGYNLICLSNRVEGLLHAVTVMVFTVNPDALCISGLCGTIFEDTAELDLSSSYHNFDRNIASSRLLAYFTFQDLFYWETMFVAGNHTSIIKLSGSLGDPASPVTKYLAPERDPLVLFRFAFLGVRSSIEASFPFLIVFRKARVRRGYSKGIWK